MECSCWWCWLFCAAAAAAAVVVVAIARITWNITNSRVPCIRCRLLLPHPKPTNGEQKCLRSTESAQHQRVRKTMSGIDEWETSSTTTIVRLVFWKLLKEREREKKKKNHLLFLQILRIFLYESQDICNSLFHKEGFSYQHPFRDEFHKSSFAFENGRFLQCWAFRTKQ